MFFHRFEKSIMDRLHCSIRGPSFTNPRNWDAEDVINVALPVVGMNQAITGGVGSPGGNSGGPAITAPVNPGMTLPPRPAVGTGPDIPVPKNAPAITRPGAMAPTMPAQTQQAISGETFNRILPSIKQYEATTGRAISDKALKAFSEQEFETAANRAAQNKSLALQEHGLDIQKWAETNRVNLATQDLDLKRFGLDSQNLFQGAQLALQKYGMDSDIALKQYAQDLQAAGMTADQAYRYADLALRAQLGQAGIDAQEAAARAQGGAAIGSLVGAGVGLATGTGPIGAAVGAGIGGTVGGGLSGLFD